MQIDPVLEKLLPLHEAFAFLAKRPCAEALWRWRTRGVHGVKLEAVRLGGRWYTTSEAVQRFISAQTAACTPSEPDDEDESSTRDAQVYSQLVDARLIDLH